jgi:hypothetical protein
MKSPQKMNKFFRKFYYTINEKQQYINYLKNNPKDCIYYFKTNHIQPNEEVDILKSIFKNKSTSENFLQKNSMYEIKFNTIKGKELFLKHYGLQKILNRYESTMLFENLFLNNTNKKIIKIILNEINNNRIFATDFRGDPLIIDNDLIDKIKKYIELNKTSDKIKEIINSHLVSIELNKSNKN